MTDDRSNRDVGIGQRGEDSVFPSHVVCSGEDMSQWGPSQYPALRCRVGDGVGEVGEPSGDQLETERGGEIRDPLLHPGGDVLGIDAGDFGCWLHERSKQEVATRYRWSPDPAAIGSVLSLSR